ncbi:helix-turn-helix domain-containing protein [Cellulomonas fimi]|uniref:Transcriptional regulator, ArsR family n=1 Tax=Cellulomonas fimi (strain ATCC 484 / DSM 20113 / JCM 1341 / CCUG 24087 / LMG 16345 / NBRC 15513 / NCIMB 8980 / NCTC 7547 / NRS-133) TaxID=590998 RepID=F4H4F7_CELFA|nr:helix-turn-helix domain-containing protein [Cellulomonas fimi]AEE47752.1 transcriptional regulator, ArsR family [Cellulomonas fimi ATCC 484]NNH06709.1 helix-turn-helix domain-containing protein [Cellulomonas fimi]VEH36933.1 Arsenate reductase [Cellulomonas fimi]
MNTEWMDEVARRAALHAALSDPGRLAVVELLSRGDASPSELARTLAVPSNLLAHHVNVLVEHGLVERTRSEGDGRRTYLRLLPVDLGTGPGALPRPARVLFVCTANSARSHLAVALWRSASDVPAASAGTHPAPAVHPGAVAAAARHDLTLGDARPRLLDDVRQDGDLVVTVCDRAHEEVDVDADVHWSIPDPVRAGTDDAFDRAVVALDRRVALLAPRLVA